MTTTTTATRSTLGVLARQEIRHYLRAKVFWLGAALSALVSVVALFDIGDNPDAGWSLAIVPSAFIGLLGISVMFGLTRRSDQAAEVAGAVAVPERTRTLALAAATVVPGTAALVSYVAFVLAWVLHPPAAYVVPPGVSDLFVFTSELGQVVVAAVGGPLLGLVLARYYPRRGAAAVLSVVVVLVSGLLQGGGLFTSEQRYRVFWIFTGFLTQRDVDGVHHFGTYAGNPYFWVLYIMVLCVLGVVVAVYHDPESDRLRLRNQAVALVGMALVLGVLAMTVGYTHGLVNPAVCESC